MQKLAAYRLEHDIANDHDAAFERAIEQADELGKVAADCRYNQAIMLREAGLRARAMEIAQDAHSRYAALGDDSSELDAAKLIDMLR